jgi:UDP-N-acetylglucosamine acyltransferase
MPKISPLSCIDSNACIADDVEIGPFCRVGPHAKIGSGCKLLSHVVVTGRTTLGCNNILHPHVVLGGPPQDKKYHDEPTRVEIGDNNQLREGVTIHLGTEAGTGCTRLGNNNLLMVNSHLGHDVQMANDCVLANNVMIAGHVVCGSFVQMMGGVGVHHFVTIGEYAYIGGAARIHHDAPPFMKIDGSDQVRGVNRVGLSRAGFSEEDVGALDEVCRRLFYRKASFALAMAELDTLDGMNPRVRRLVEFLRRRDEGKHGRYLERFRAVGRVNPT